MCEPTTAAIAIATMSAAQAGLTYIEGTQAAKAQSEAIENSAKLQLETNAEQQQQITKQSIDEMSARAREATIERGRLKAIQGESGLMGNSQDRVMNESYFNEGTDMASIEGNRKASLKQSQLEAKGIASGAQSQMNAIKRPFLIGAGLQIGAAGVQGYTSYKVAKASAKGA